MELDFLLICRDNEEYFKFIFPKIINKLKIFEPNFYIYENNSTDNTKNLLIQFNKQYKNIYVKSENIKVYENRFKNICIARNKLLDFYRSNNKNETIKWTILFDTNIIFNEKTVIELINKIKYEGVMYCSNTLFYDFFNNNIKYYYDILALNYGYYFQKKMAGTFEINKYLNYDKDKGITEIETGFGGLVLIKKDILLNSGGWHLIKSKKVDNLNIPLGMICEHWDFCNKIKKIGKIYIVNDSKAIWYLDKYLLNNIKKIKFYNYLNNIGFFNLKIKNN